MACFLCSLQDMESWILHLLKWDLSAIVPNDFLDHILHRMPFNKYDVHIIKRRAQTIAALCATGEAMDALCVSGCLS